jgi:menaquinone-dependent protoporphyrinogen oxidase
MSRWYRSSLTRRAALQQTRLRGGLSQEVPLRGHEVFSGVFQADQMSAPLRSLFRVYRRSIRGHAELAAVDTWTAKPASSLSSDSTTL